MHGFTVDMRGRVRNFDLPKQQPHAYHAYIEVISFDKLINYSEKRNRVLFDKLGI